MTVTEANDLFRLQWEIERFLYEEAALLEDRRFTEWIDWVTDDIVYGMPLRVTRSVRDLDKQFVPLSRGGHFNDNKHTLMVRAKKLADPKSWSENPPSAPRIAITNVRIRETDREDEFLVLSNILFTRVRLDHIYAPITGRREDLLRRADTRYGFALARRMIYLDHAVLPGSGINTLL